MGFAKKKRKIREAISKWKCFGYFGYGQGRAVALFGEEDMKKKSACIDICTRASACRLAHHRQMNIRYPQLGQLVESAARLAQLRRLNVVDEVVNAMESAVEMKIDEAVDVRKRLSVFRVDQMTDHYRCGQFENIQNGLDKASPDAKRAEPGDIAQAS